MYKEIKGDLIAMALNGNFDVIAHGCNCFCTMGAGIAAQMAKTFNSNFYHLESKYFKGNINKLGSIDSQRVWINLEDSKITCDEMFDTGVVIFYEYNYLPEDLFIGKEVYRKLCTDLHKLFIVNAYTQYNLGANLDYEALALCLRKINHVFKGKHIGLPKIGCGIAGGDWEIVKKTIQKELKDCNVTIVIYEES